jgi:hypothetical protein
MKAIACGRRGADGKNRENTGVLFVPPAEFPLIIVHPIPSFPASLALWTGAPCSRLRRTWVDDGRPDFLYAAPDMACAAFSKESQ